MKNSLKDSATYLEKPVCILHSDLEAEPKAIRITISIDNCPKEPPTLSKQYELLEKKCQLKARH